MYWLQVNKGGQYMNLRFLSAESVGAIGIGSGTGVVATPGGAYDGGQDWYNQDATNLAADAASRLVVGALYPAGAAVYHFFTHDGDDHVWVVWKVTDGVWNYLGFGANLNNGGTYTGGRYLCAARPGNAYSAAAAPSIHDGVDAASLPPGHSRESGFAASALVQLDYDSLGLEWQGVVDTVATSNSNGRRLLSSCPSTYGQATSGGRGGIYVADTLFQRSRMGVNEGIAPVETIFSAERTDGTYSIIGELPNVLAMRNDGTVQDGTVETISTDDYVVFPSFAVLKDA